MKASTNHVLRTSPRAMALAVLAATSLPAAALEFSTDAGWNGSVNTTLSASASWRAEGRDKALLWDKNAALIGVGGASAAGITPGWGGALTDDGNLNYGKGDRYQTLYKFLTELDISKQGTGALIRVKGWYDQSLNDKEVPWGNGTTGYAWESRRTSRKLSDKGFDPLAKFDGIHLLDAYGYTEFDVGAPLQIRVGRQAINWGESLFIQGVNQLAPLDVIALRKAGTEIKEALLPVWSIYGNLGLPMGMSLEAYYQLKWEPTAIDSCGTYWAPVDLAISTSPNGCNMTQFSVAGLETDQANTGIDAILGVKGFKPKDGGQWGIALRVPVESIDTEFGLYAMNIHSRTPIISGYYSGGTAFLATGAGQQAVVAMTMRKLGLTNPAQAIAALANPALSGLMARHVLANSTTSFWEYPEDIQIFGISAATNIMGWSTGWELSLQKDVPVQFNGNDMLAVAATGAGPLASVITGRGIARGDMAHGYERYDKTQFQVNGVYLLPSMLGATNGLLVAEAAFQWSDVPGSDGTKPRYGRGFIFGSGGTDAADRCTPTAASLAGGTYNPQQDGCKNDGYIDDFAWGYRIRASLDYPGMLGGSWTITPTLFWAHDVDGYSLDSQFVKDRQVLSLGVGFNKNKVHNVSLNYTMYSNDATFDMFRDRDNYSIAYSYTF